MLTYNEIYEAARKERYSEQLQKLPKDFVKQVSEYFNQKKEMASKEDFFSDVVMKTKKQLENATTLFKELLLRRKKKILGLVLVAAETGISKQDYDNMLEHEKSLFEDFMKCLEISDKKLEAAFSESNGISSKNQLVIFKENVEAFVDLDGKKIGPFEKEEVANIPKEIAKILLDSGKVEVLLE